jgi:TPR repeat protein
MEALLLRGDQMFALQDISAARLLYERAAALGSARAARELGRAHDPTVLDSLGMRGPRGDAAVAARWYRRAAALGDPAAEALLRALRGTDLDLAGAGGP